MKEKLRDKTRDKLVHALNALGIGAAMAERGRPEERHPEVVGQTFPGRHRHTAGTDQMHQRRQAGRVTI